MRIYENSALHLPGSVRQVRKEVLQALKEVALQLLVQIMVKRLRPCTEVSRSVECADAPAACRGGDFGGGGCAPRRL